MQVIVYVSKLTKLNSCLIPLQSAINFIQKTFMHFYRYIIHNKNSPLEISFPLRWSTKIVSEK